MSSDEDSGLIATRVLKSERSVGKKAKLHRDTESQSRVCPHCDQLLNIKTYKRHEKLYRKDDGSWIVVSSRQTSEGS